MLRTSRLDERPTYSCCDREHGPWSITGRGLDSPSFDIVDANHELLEGLKMGETSDIKQQIVTSYSVRSTP